MDSSPVTRRDALKGAGLALVTFSFAEVTTACSTSTPGKGRGAGGGSDTENDTLAQIKKQGYASLAIANEPPYTKVNPDGTVTGAAPDIAHAALKGMGVPKVQGVVTPYDTMIPGLKAGRWDIITAGLFMKQSRCEQIAYSEPQVVSTESFAVPPGNPKNLHNVADLKKNSKVKVAALPGAFEFGVLQGKGIPDSQIVKVKDGRSGIEAVAAGRADAFMLPTLSLKALKTKKTKFEVTPPIQDVPPTGAGAGFRKSDTKFRDAYNKSLHKFKQTDEYAKLLRKWGFSAEAVKGVTTEQLCKNPG
ncbi:MAG: ectoine/hydroxyectoine ABC transporter substrate-binding protein EhuB [Streptosporangiales bacterium]